MASGMSNPREFGNFRERLRTAMQNGADAPPANRAADSWFNEYARELFSLQFEGVEPYQKFCQARGSIPGTIQHWTQIPAFPVSAFKEHTLTSLSPAERTTIFYSSGTTGAQRSAHYHNPQSLALYEHAILSGIKSCRRPIPDPIRFLSLTPSPEAAPNSSLVYMLGVLHRSFGIPGSEFTGAVDATGAWSLPEARVLPALQRASEENCPVLIAGTAFSFVELESILKYQPVQLPPGSRLFETGGYKGRTQAIPRHELYSRLEPVLGVPQTAMISEYGMCELNSQAYAFPESDDEAAPITFQFPFWARVQIVSPETGLPAEPGTPGLIRIFDLANVSSIMALETADLGVAQPNGFLLAGRIPQAEARGCSLLTNS
jgi:hypothetical protein